MSNKGELYTRLEFGKRIGSTIVDITNDEDSLFINVREENEKEEEGRGLFLEPEEVDMLIAVLTLYKKKITNPKKYTEE